ncbi:unnamed protein product [Bemisia tabaci]|uniref:Uncharacterized protein n=1 Tax=Bemisia tabaci TaxID=7038 RepID=A0A9P0AAA4_BEMTA|nr:unnamed protein product [Bemisia tabaci]
MGTQPSSRNTLIPFTNKRNIIRTGGILSGPGAFLGLRREHARLTSSCEKGIISSSTKALCQGMMGCKGKSFFTRLRSKVRTYSRKNFMEADNPLLELIKNQQKLASIILGRAVRNEGYPECLQHRDSGTQTSPLPERTPPVVTLEDDGEANEGLAHQLNPLGGPEVFETNPTRNGSIGQLLGRRPSTGPTTAATSIFTQPCSAERTTEG